MSRIQKLNLKHEYIRLPAYSFTSQIAKMNFYSELLDTNISICKTKDGFVAAAELDYVKYKSESICEGLISNITIAQFDKLHSKFKPEVSFVNQKINVVYDIEFLGAKITFILHKENLTSEKEMLIKYKKHSEIISRLEDKIQSMSNKIQSMSNKIQSMQEAKDISSTVHVVKLICHVKKGMYFNVPDLISDKFYKMMHTFYNCPIYPQHVVMEAVFRGKISMTALTNYLLILMISI